MIIHIRQWITGKGSKNCDAFMLSHPYGASPNVALSSLLSGRERCTTCDSASVAQAIRLCTTCDSASVARAIRLTVLSSKVSQVRGREHLCVSQGDSAEGRAVWFMHTQRGCQCGSII